MAAELVARRAVAAVVGGLVADAGALPIHWIYDVTKLDSVVGGRPDPEFLPESHCPFYRIPTGLNSCYGDQQFVILESLTESKGFNNEDYKKRLHAKFGPGTKYVPSEPATKPVSNAWRNGSITVFLENYDKGSGDPKDDGSSDGLVKVAPIVALYAGRPEMLSIVRDVVRVTQANDNAVNAAVACAQVLEHYILHGATPDVVQKLVKDMPEAVIGEVKEAIKVKGVEHRAVVQKFGSHCGNPNTLKNCMHALMSSGGEYVATVREDMLAGGDNCGRLGFIGAAMAAQTGLDSIPKDWLSKTDCGKKVMDLAERLVKLRSS